jgi:hypothetical protein
MPVPIPAESLLGRLQTVADPRRANRQYPLAGILGALILGMLNGQTSGSGAWDWARQHWGQIWRSLGFHSPHCPVYSTVWNLLRTLDAEALDQVIVTWLEAVLDHPGGGLSVDGKTLRGRRRGPLAGLKLVSLFQHELGVVLGQQQVPAGTGEQPTALTLLRGTPLQGRVVTLDAGLLNAEATQVITTGGGNYVGVVKENYPSVKADIDAWIADQGVAFSPCDPASAGRPDRHQRPWTLRNPGAVAGASGRPRAVSGAGMGLGRGAAGGLAATAAATAASWWVGR